MAERKVYLWADALAEKMVLEKVGRKVDQQAGRTAEMMELMKDERKAEMRVVYLAEMKGHRRVAWSAELWEDALERTKVAWMG